MQSQNAIPPKRYSRSEKRWLRQRKLKVQDLLQHENTELMQTKLDHQDFSHRVLDSGRNSKPARMFELVENARLVNR